MQNRVFSPPTEPAPQTLPTDVVSYRWLIRADLPQVLSIEQQSWEFPWTEEEFLDVLNPRHETVSMVAEKGFTIVGYMLYQLERDHFHLLNLAVHPDHRRQGIGAALMARMAKRIGPVRTKIVADIRETNLPAQQFLRAIGMTATEVLRNFYEDCDDDAYRFVFPVRGGAH